MEQLTLFVCLVLALPVILSHLQNYKILRLAKKLLNRNDVPLGIHITYLVVQQEYRVSPDFEQTKGQ